MPELPEVETIRKDLARLIVGKKILDIKTDSPKQVQPSLAAVKKAILGATIKKIKRRAKLLQIFLSNGRVLAVHLKLTGRLLVRKKGAPRDDWQHVVIKLKAQNSPASPSEAGRAKLKTEDLELRFCDLRKFGWIRLVKDEKELEALLSKFGPEPFVGKASSGFTLRVHPEGQALTLDEFKKILARTSRPIKIVLMDQKKISGVGNIYASDALFLAKIDPRRLANKVSEKETAKLLKAIENVLKAGIKYRGASDQYYLDALGRKGSYQDHFLVYAREGEKCFDCKGRIKRIKLGGRGTFFCPTCQK